MQFLFSKVSVLSDSPPQHPPPTHTHTHTHTQKDKIYNLTALPILTKLKLTVERGGEVCVCVKNEGSGVRVRLDAKTL